MLRFKEKHEGIIKTSYGYDIISFSAKNRKDRNSSVSYVWIENELKQIKIGFAIIGAVKIMDQILVTDDQSRLWVLDSQLNIIEKILPDYFSNLPDSIIKNFDENYLIADKGDVFNRDYTLFQYNNLKEVFRTDHVMKGFANSFMILEMIDMSYSGVIKLYNLNADLIWEQNLLDYIELKLISIKEVIGHSFVVINGDNKSISICFKTGELLWKSDDYLLRVSKSNYKGDKFISFNQGYVEYDLRTGQRKIEQDVRQRYDDFGRGGSPSFWQSDEMIVTIPGRQNKIYFYDIVQDEMIYIYEEKEAKPYLSASPIYYHEGHLFVKDFNDTLFVYELEEGLANKLEGNKTLT